MKRVYKLLTTIVFVAIMLFAIKYLYTTNIIASVILGLIAIVVVWSRHFDNSEDDDTDGYDLETY